MKKLILLGLMLLFSGMVLAQKSYTKAEALFASRDYFPAAAMYKDALKVVSDANLKRSIFFKVAECYRMMNFYTEAITWYEDAIANGYKDPKVYISYGDMLARAGELDKAIQAYNEYLKIVPGDATGKKKVASCEFAKDAMKFDNKFNPVKNETALNSEFSEFGLAWLSEDLLFASNRKGPKDKIHSRTGEGFSDVYMSEFDEVVKQFSAPVLAAGGINTAFNDGSAAYDERNSVLYVMQTNGYMGKGNLNKVKFANGQWSKPVASALNNKEYSVGHPSIAKDGKILYFVSDMPGGKGGNDIWMVTLSSDGSYGAPVNLGDGVNTPDDELFPFIIGDSMLFFASNGHPGMGGLDIFCARKKDGKFVNPANLGYPINTASDDFNLIIRENLKGGLLCSNRPKGSGNDDIYSFPNFPIVLTASGVISDFLSGNPVPEAMVVFSNPAGINDTVFSDNNGKYLYKGIMPAETYRIDVSHSQYFPDNKELKTLSGEFFMEYNKQSGYNIDFALIGKPSPRFHIAGKVTERSTGDEMKDEKIVIRNKLLTYEDMAMTDSLGKYGFSWLVPTFYTAKIMKRGYWSESRSCDATSASNQEIYSLETGHDMNFELTKIEPKKEIVLNNIYYDLGKATLRAESMAELDKVVSMMRETPNIQIEMSAHTDARGDDRSNMKLSQARAKSCVDYLVQQGIDKRRLIAKGYGETRLVIPNARSEEEHQKNRRTTLSVIKVIENKNAGYSANDKFEFMVQIISSPSALSKDVYFEKLMRHMPSVKIEIKEEKKDGKTVMIYHAGIFEDLKKAVKLKEKIKALGYVECVVLPYKNKSRISVTEALELLEK